MKPTQMEEYLFDLRGYLVLKNAVDPSHLEALNAILDTYMDLEPDAWRGWVYRARHEPVRHLHNIFEMGEPFERLIDHPSWMDHMNRFVGGDDGLFIDESFLDVRGKSGSTRMHSGAHKRRIRTQFRFHNNAFRCGQINILLALKDVGPGDGATMVIPGSHKSNLLHPAFEDPEEHGANKSLDRIEAAVQVQLEAGDAAFFVDCLAHGSSMRINEGERRIAIIRYGPQWGSDRYGFQPSPELLGRLTPPRRKIVQPLSPKRPPQE
ncbi:MAG: phytanoyl-CoA dioxygenase family protein [bacterium]|nr:phytanoyl-CoA dioxygenase family protein [bacterium]